MIPSSELNLRLVLGTHERCFLTSQADFSSLPGPATEGNRAEHLQAAVGRLPASAHMAVINPRGVWADVLPGLDALPPTPSPIITAMFYRQSLDGVSGNHFGLSSIKGSNEKSISLVNR